MKTAAQAHPRTRPSCLFGICMAVWAGLIPTGSSRAIAADPPSGTASAREVSPKGELGPPYVDASFGFTLRAPAGSVVEKEKRMSGTADFELVRFVQLDHVWSLMVRLSKTDRPLTASMIIEGITKNLRGQSEELKVLRGDETRIANREAVRYTASFVAADRAWLRQQAVIRKSPTEYYALVLITPLDDGPIAQTAFDAITASFDILRSELTQQQLDEALERGKVLRRGVADGRPAKLSSLPEQQSFLLMIQDGKERGFVNVHSKPTTFAHRSGIAILEQGWLFGDDGSANRVINERFISDDLTYDRWDDVVTSLIPAQPGPGWVATLGSVERGLRTRDTLMLAWTNEVNDDRLQDKAVQVDDRFASPGWFVVAPRLIDLKEPGLYAFAGYSRDRRGLQLRTLRVGGPELVEVGGQKVRATLIEDSEGLIPPITRCFADAQGRLVRIEAEGLVMVAATQPEVERKFKAKVDAALREFKAQPLRIPEPIDRETTAPTRQEAK